MKKFTIVLLVLCVLGSLAFAEENNYKPTFSLSANGGNGRNHEFNFNFETLYAQSFKNWGLQASAMGNISKSIREFGFSAGLWHSFGRNMQLAIFGDGLYLGKIPVYGQGGFHFQIRPEARFANNFMSLSAFYAIPITKRVLLGTSIIGPVFWENSSAIYSDTTTIHSFARAIPYWGGEITVTPVKPLKLYAEGLVSEKRDMYRIRTGGEFKVLDWFGLGAEFVKMSAKNALGAFMGGNFSSIRAVATIYLDGNQGKGFGNLDRKIFTPKYPVVVLEQNTTTETKKIADKYTLTVEWCDGVGGTPSRGTYTYINGEKVDYKYFLLKDYINLHVNVDGVQSEDSGRVVMDKDHKISVCADYDTKYTLTVEWCEGVGGIPAKGTHSYSKGERVNYQYFLLQHYVNLRVGVDDTHTQDSGVVIMDKDHYIRVCAEKEQQCLPVKIISFTASKLSICRGEYVTLNWVTENGKVATLNNMNVSLSGSKVVRPGVNAQGEIGAQCTYVTYTLKVSNDCSQLTKTLTIEVR